MPVQRRQITLRTTAITSSDTVAAIAAPINPKNGIRIAKPARRSAILPASTNGYLLSWPQISSTVDAGPPAA